MELPVKYDNLTPKDRRKVRLHYIDIQNNLCCHCNYDLDGDPPKNILEKKINWTLFPKGFLNHPIHLHHDHNTGLTIGAIHAYCNAYLWDYCGQ